MDDSLTPHHPDQHSECLSDKSLQSLTNIKEYSAEQAIWYQHVSECESCRNRWREIKFTRWVNRVSNAQPNVIDITNNAEFLNELISRPGKTVNSTREDDYDSSWSTLSIGIANESDHGDPWPGLRFDDYLVGDRLSWTTSELFYQAIDVRKGQLAIIWLNTELDGTNEDHARAFFAGVNEVRQVEHEHCLAIQSAGTVQGVMYVAYLHRSLRPIIDSLSAGKFPTIYQSINHAYALSTMLTAFHRNGLTHGSLRVEQLYLDDQEKIVLTDMVLKRIKQLMLESLNSQLSIDAGTIPNKQLDVAAVGAVINALVNSDYDLHRTESKPRDAHETPAAEHEVELIKKLREIADRCQPKNEHSFESAAELRLALESLK